MTFNLLLVVLLHLVGALTALACLSLITFNSEVLSNAPPVAWVPKAVRTTQNPADSKTCVITISAWNNFGFVWNLYDSIVENSPTIGCFIWFVGDVSVHPDKEAALKIRKIMTIADRFAVVTMADMEQELGDSFKPLELAFKFDMVELQTTIKPFAFQYVFQKFGASSTIFLDNDIWVTSSLLPIQKELQNRSAVVTPHILSPIPEDGKKQKDIDILTSGVFNFGFVAFRNSPTAKAFLEFWSQRLTSYGFVDVENGMFYDQNWGMFIPAFFDHEDYMVIRDLRYNVAYWNLHDTGAKLHLDERTGLPFLDDEQAIFVHFSGMSLLEEYDMYGISRHQSRYTLSDFPRMKKVVKEYILKLQVHNALEFRSIPYGYGTFLDGTRIDSLMRKEYAAAMYSTRLSNVFADSEAATPFHEISIYDRLAFQTNVAKNPFCTSKVCRDADTTTFLEWYLLHIPGSAMDLEGLFFFSGIEQGVWKKRPDLQVAFPDPTGVNFIAFKDWWLKSAVNENMVSPELYQIWYSAWKFHCENHEQYHKTASSAVDIGVNIIGWHGGQFSIGIISNKLHAAATEVKIRANAVALPSPPREGKRFAHPSLLGYELTRSPCEIVNIIAVNADSTFFAMQNVPSILRENKYNIGYWAWELEIFPKLWMGFLKQYDEIWCLSLFVKNSIESSSEYDGTPVKVLNLPLLHAEAHHSTESSEVMPPNELTSIKTGVDPFTFLVMFDFKSCMERKNPLAAIRAFLDAFPKEFDPAGKYRLVVKSHSGTSEEVEKMHDAAQQDSRIVFISRILTDAENIALHKMQDCYVSLHRSEGYGLNILESMGAGVPVIATNYSGNVEFFLSAPRFLERCHFPVPYKLLKLKENVGPYEAGNHWADPDHRYVVASMRKVAQNDCKKKFGEEISRKVYDRFGQAAIGRKMQSLLEDATPRILKKQREINFNKDFVHRTLEAMQGLKR